MSSYDIEEMQPNLFKLVLCLKRFYIRSKNILSDLLEYDLYRGTKWEDYN